MSFENHYLSLREGEDQLKKVQHQLTGLSVFCLQVKCGFLLGQTAEVEKDEVFK